MILTMERPTTEGWSKGELFSFAPKTSFGCGKDSTIQTSTATFPKRGFILDSSFMDIHNNHNHLINTSYQHCDELTILVCTLPSDDNGYLRYKAIRDQFPQVNVVWCNEDLPQEIHKNVYFWVIWKSVVQKYCGENIDLTFGYDSYAIILSKLLDCKAKVFKKPTIKIVH